MNPNFSLSFVPNFADLDGSSTTLPANSKSVPLISRPKPEPTALPFATPIMEFATPVANKQPLKVSDFMPAPIGVSTPTMSNAVTFSKVSSLANPIELAQEISYATLLNANKHKIKSARTLLVYSANGLHQLLDEVRKVSERDSEDDLLSSSGVNASDFSEAVGNNSLRYAVVLENKAIKILFAQEGAPTSKIPAHYQMTGKSKEEAKVLAAGNLFFDNDWNCITGFSNKSGDFRPPFETSLYLVAGLVHVPSLRKLVKTATKSDPQPLLVEKQAFGLNRTSSSLEVTEFTTSLEELETILEQFKTPAEVLKKIVDDNAMIDDTLQRVYQGRESQNEMSLRPPKSSLARQGLFGDSGESSLRKMKALISFQESQRSESPLFGGSFTQGDKLSMRTDSDNNASDSNDLDRLGGNSFSFLGTALNNHSGRNSTEGTSSSKENEQVARKLNF